MTNKIILGIDPGSRITGFGVIELIGKQPNYIAAGTINCSQEDISTRLFYIHDQINQLIERFQPQEFAIEQIFTFVNHQSALKLGQARGAAESTPPRRRCQWDRHYRRGDVLYCLLAAFIFLSHYSSLERGSSALLPVTEGYNRWAERSTLIQDVDYG